MKTILNEQTMLFIHLWLPFGIYMIEGNAPQSTAPNAFVTSIAAIALLLRSTGACCHPIARPEEIEGVGVVKVYGETTTKTEVDVKKCQDCR